MINFSTSSTSRNLLMAIDNNGYLKKEDYQGLEAGSENGWI